MKNQYFFTASGAIGAFLVSSFHFLYGEDPIRYSALFLYLMLIVMDWIGGSPSV
ncbi:hypothetical protein [Ammoniphilus oxalaticus]|uniref:hypothetical protein n=1 Tax=Ammoniphilus oxalaticus TaxID=66863 RepID=UPI001472B61D|nr:hypothetical protein [Ammoniphilus oxalaticus]